MRRIGLILALVGATAAAAEREWKNARTEDDGLRVEIRDGVGTSMPEVRVTATVKAAPAALLAAAWELRSKGMQALYLKERSVISETERERVYFLKVHPPIIGQRQCVIRQSRWSDGAEHITYRALKLPPADDGVRLFSQLYGEWRFEPAAGGSQLTYVALVDVGGVPAWLARGPQIKATIDTVREVIARAGELGNEASPLPGSSR